MLSVLTGVFGVGVALAQGGATSTPVTVILPEASPVNVVGETATPTWTPTVAPLAVLEPIDFANVRDAPDINAQDIGDIQSGERFTVIGRSGLWYQFQYDRAPNGIGWVYSELVTITGDVNAIPELTLQPVATVDPLILGATQTVAAALLLPGGEFTITAAAGGLVGTLAVGNPAASDPRATTPPEGTALPTFTYPPGIVRVTPIAVADAGIATELDVEEIEILQSDLQRIPPILPILALGGLGVLGLMVSGYRRK
ncbi:MAG: SH3 domain-containing protein [Chloroflexota bacterium]|nr:SH3 domain-containing protein [Chloroflexota bacterium]